MGNHLFVIFAVLDVSLAVNLCINCSFFYIFTHTDVWHGIVGFNVPLNTL